MRLYLSHSTGTELMSFYERELAMLRKDETIPWLHQHDKIHASAVLAGEESTPVDASAPTSGMAALA